MARFDDLFNESDEEWVARSKKDIANLPKTKDTRTSGQKAKDQALRDEQRRWLMTREAAQAAQQERIKREREKDFILQNRRGTSAPYGSGN